MTVPIAQREFGFVLAVGMLLFRLPACADDSAGFEFFEKKIRPVLVGQCYECHSSAVARPKGQLVLDSRDGIRKGGETGPAVVPGDVAKSLLIDAIRYESLEMPPPPNRKLSAHAIADFEAWIKMGAPDPRDKPGNPSVVERELWEALYQTRKEWWSLQPVFSPSLPTTYRTDWSDQPIDRFILSMLEKHKLQPTARADSTTLIRRLTFVLTGLPPTLEELSKFKRDCETDPQQAYARLVDGLLKSPHFGEHWARHWMDVVRYTDTYGYEWDIPAKGAWRYRDYLIRAFNSDVPYDQLVREQIAGDLLEQPRINADDKVNESLIGTMFFQMGEKRHGDSSEFNGIHQEMLDNKIDAFSKAFQATTIACARCHDHKLDAIAQTEYYALAGMFMSSRWITNTADLPERNADVFRQLKVIKTRLRPLMARQWQDDLKSISVDQLTQLAAAGSKANPNGLPLEHALHTWSQLLNAKDSTPESVWNGKRKQYATERESRKQENGIHFRTVIDFRDGLGRDIQPDASADGSRLEGWSIDGVGLLDRVPVGDFTVALSGDATIGQVLPGGLFTGALSPRLNGAVRTPYLNTLSSGHISFEAYGGDFAAHRTVYDNAFLTEKQTYLNNRLPQGFVLSTLKSHPDRRIYIEFATKTSNPNFPPRVGLGGACSEDQAADPKSWFGIARVFLHDVPRMPADELDRFESLFEGGSPSDSETAKTRYVTWFQRAVENWSNDKTTPADVEILNWLLDNGLVTNRQHESVATLVSEYRAVEQQIALPWTVNGMADVDPGYDYRLSIRGDYDQLAAAPPRDYVRVVKEAVTKGTLTEPSDEPGTTELPTPATPERSGRRQLAEWIASPHNPLTARVYVNRIWQQLFGSGIVATSNDFGHLGQQPTHPELLDYLASRFMSDGWSMKQLIRAIVMTETWRQATGPSDPSDPRNQLLHHFPFRRLEAESIRDAMLASSGRLDRSLFGPTTNPFRANEDDQKRLFCGPLDGNGRRSIYTKITIMEPPRFLALFNQPVPKIPIGQRDVTNTPAQSLALLNDPFVIGQAEFWAKQLVQRNDASVEVRLGHIFESAIGRKSSADELQRWHKAVDEFAADHQIAPANILSSIPVWQEIAHAVFNMKEFIYLR